MLMEPDYLTMESPRMAYPDLNRKPESHSPVMGSSRLSEGIENKTLEFDIDVEDAVFNKPGRYFIKMTIQSLFTKDYSRILLKEFPSNDFRHDHEALTSVTTQAGTEKDPQLCMFSDRKFTFRLPAGFCKNDRNHDVYLLLEAFLLPMSDDEEEGRKVGEGKVAIYPRTNAPKINHSVGPAEDMYRHTPVVTLLRSPSQSEKTEMHCGRMRCTFSLQYVDMEAEARKRREEERRRREDNLNRIMRLQPSPRRVEQVKEDPFQTRSRLSRTPEKGKAPPPKTKSPTPSSEWGKAPPLTPSPPPLEDPKRRMLDSPLPEYNHSTFTANQTWRHVARKGKQQIDVILHGGNGVPMATGDKVPQPYVLVQTSADRAANQKAKAKTHAVVRPTDRPSWEEMVTMEINETKADRESIVLTVGDAISRDELVHYSIPCSSLQPFHQYHLELVLPVKGHVNKGVKIYASIIRKETSLPHHPESPNYLGLEVFLRGVRKPLASPKGPLIAVARIVPDYHNYKDEQLTPRCAGICMDTVTFPNPIPRSFTVQVKSSQGHPQVSLPGRPEERPAWNHPYLFTDEKDKATMFTPNAALVIEFYQANEAQNNEYWSIKSPVGFASLLLNQKVYEQLVLDKAEKGMRVDGVRVKGSDLRNTDGVYPQIGMVLKLITKHQPESLVGMSNLDNLPSLEVEPRTESLSPDVLAIDTPSEISEADEEVDLDLDEEEEDKDLVPGLYLHRLGKSLAPINDGELPPYDAVESILPEYQYIFVDPKTGAETDRSTKFKPAAPSRTVNPSVNRDSIDLEQTHMSVLDHQMKDLGNYRNAVQRMGQDILTLRGTVRDLQGTNSKLRTDLQHYDESKKLLIDASDLDTLAKPELAARYASIRQKLAAQTSDLKDYKTKVQKLQNELIKKNDKEKDYLRMTHAHASQQELLQRLQDKVLKVRKLEETCKKQEKVIEKLESVLRRLRDKTDKGGALSEANAVLSDENKRLRQQIEDLKDQLTRAGMGGGEDMEKLELYQALERAEGRIMSLEKQLQENSRSWGKERADMNIRMNEAEHGFGRSGGMVLHDYPVLESSYGGFNVPSRLGSLLK